MFHIHQEKLCSALSLSTTPSVVLVVVVLGLGLANEGRRMINDQQWKRLPGCCLVLGQPRPGLAWLPRLVFRLHSEICTIKTSPAYKTYQPPQ